MSCHCYLLIILQSGKQNSSGEVRLMMKLMKPLRKSQDLIFIFYCVFMYACIYVYIYVYKNTLLHYPQ